MDLTAIRFPSAFHLLFSNISRYTPPLLWNVSPAKTYMVNNVMTMSSKPEGLESSKISSPDTPTMSSKTETIQSPPPEKPAAILTRTKVIAAFWAVIIFLGFPIWWQTTSVHRARLPIQEMVDWASGKVIIASNTLVGGL